MTRVTPNNIQELKRDEIFVFGSNARGQHDGGAAKLAHEKFGAIYGKGNGHHGNTYAINSMDGLFEMDRCIKALIDYAKTYKHLTFFVTEIGCGIAGYTPEQIAPLFKDAKELENVYLPQRFLDLL